MSDTSKMKRDISALSGALLCSLGMMVFAFFIPYTLPLRLISFGALMVPAIVISKSIGSCSELWKITGKVSSLSVILWYSVAAVSCGLILGTLYRWKLDESLFPGRLGWFALTAAAIGVGEELVFRGFIQESVRNRGAAFSIAFSTLVHTGYKSLLFLSPASAHDINIGFLVFWTLLAGSIIGTIRHLSASIIPSLSAHAIFDVIVYGGLASAPWWVW